MKLHNNIIHRLTGLFVRSPQKIVGVDIGSGLIKAAELAWGNGQPVLTAAGVLDLPEHVVKDGYILDSYTLADRIQHLLATSGISSRDVVVAVAGRAVFVREVLFPVMSKEELKEAVKWDMEKYVPYEPGSYYFDFAVIGPGNNDLELKVLLVAAPYEVVNTLITAFKLANCQLLAIDIEPLAVVRTLSEVHNVMVIDIGATVSQLSIFQAASPAVTRLIAIGGRQFTEIIMRTLELEYVEAERLKRLFGMRKDNDFKSGWPILEPRFQLLVSELAREIQRTVEHFQLQHLDFIIERIYLTGGGSKLGDLSEYLRVQLGGAQVLQHNPLQMVSLDASLNREYLYSLAPQLAVAIGLALHGENNGHY